MADIFGGTQVPAWLVERTNVYKPGQMGSVLGTLSAGLANAMQRDPGAPNDASWLKSRKGFFEGLTEARKNQIDPAWRLTELKTKVGIAAQNVQMQHEIAMTEQLHKELIAQEEDAKIAGEWMTATPDKRKSMTQPAFKSIKYNEIAQRTRDHDVQYGVAKEVADYRLQAARDATDMRTYIGELRAQTDLERSKDMLNRAKEDRESREKIAEMGNIIKELDARIKAMAQTESARIAADSRVEVADITGGSRVQAASIAADARLSGSATSWKAADQVRRMIEEIDKNMTIGKRSVIDGIRKKGDKATEGEKIELRRWDARSAYRDKLEKKHEQLMDEAVAALDEKGTAPPPGAGGTNAPAGAPTGTKSPIKRIFRVLKPGESAEKPAEAQGPVEPFTTPGMFKAWEPTKEQMAEGPKPAEKPKTEAKPAAQESVGPSGTIEWGNLLSYSKEGPGGRMLGGQPTVRTLEQMYDAGRISKTQAMEAAPRLFGYSGRLMRDRIANGPEWKKPTKDPRVGFWNPTGDTVYQ